MRIFIAGGTGVLGRRIVPLLVAAGHEVTATTRRESSVGPLRELGAEAVTLDVYDAARVHDAVVGCRPDLVMHQLTDLPDDPADLPRHAAANARIRRVGTRHLVAAAQAAGASRMVAQSVAWQLEGAAGDAVADLERQVLAFGGVVVRYGQLYGPGTFHPHGRPDEGPSIHVDEAARRTLDVLEMPAGVVTVVDVPTDT